MQEVTDKSIEWQTMEAVSKLKEGGVVAFPTETVYGLGADASNEQAIKKVFSVKNRPCNHPLIVHLAHGDDIERWSTNIPEAAYLLSKYFWPGPLTLILEKHPDVSPLITGNQDTIGLRVPQHPLTLELIRQLGPQAGIVGPSANLYGHVSPTTAEHVKSELGSKISAILDGGPCMVGIESTIVALLGKKSPVILRQGDISSNDIAQVLGYKVDANLTNSAIRSPGNQKQHYAPRTPLHIIDSHSLLETAMRLQQQGKRCAILSFNAAPSSLSSAVAWHQTVCEPKSYARNLYANLRMLDQLQLDVILIERPPWNQPAWQAIYDRLQRASYSMEHEQIQV